MKTLPSTIALLVTCGAAQAANLPAFEVTCPDDVAVRAEAGGPVYIGDKPAVLSKFSEQYFEAKGEGTTIAISLRGAGSPNVTYSGPQGAKGVCEEKQEEEQAAAEQNETPPQPQE